jgi:hypothetical protein
MALLYVEGFEDGLDRVRPNVVASNALLSTSYGKEGRGARFGDSGNQRLNIASMASAIDSGVTVWASFDLRIITGQQYGATFEFGNTSGDTNDETFHILLFWDSDTKNFKVATHTGTYSTPATTSATNVWYHVTLEFSRHDSAGHFKLYIDGVEVLSETSQDTNRGGDGYAAFHGNGWYNTEAYDVDNIVIYDSTGTEFNTYQGILRVDSLAPNGNGNSSMLVGSDADSTDNYLLVDETPADTADYVGSATEGDKDTYAFTDLTGTDTPIAVEVAVYALKSDSGTKFLRTVLRSGGVDYNGTSEAAAEGWLGYTTLYELDPDGDAAWDVAAVDALEAGYEVRDS